MSPHAGSTTFGPFRLLLYVSEAQQLAFVQGLPSQPTSQCALMVDAYGLYLRSEDVGCDSGREASHHGLGHVPTAGNESGC